MSSHTNNQNRFWGCPPLAGSTNGQQLPSACRLGCPSIPKHEGCFLKQQESDGSGSSRRDEQYYYPSQLHGYISCHSASSHTCGIAMSLDYVWLKESRQVHIIMLHFMRNISYSFFHVNVCMWEILKNSLRKASNSQH